jgi:hypothetical protein
MLKYLIRYSFFILLLFTISLAAGFIEICHELDVDLHDAFSAKALLSPGFTIAIDLRGPFDNKTPEAEYSSLVFSIFHPPRIS